MSISSFQPFLISEFKTGLFNYLEPWTRAQDAFDPLEDAYVYRGTLNKRLGYAVLGRMSYRDNNIALGNGGKTYSGTLATHPIVAGSFHPSDVIETFTDDGLGVLTGSAGGTGTINYTSGAWTLAFNANVANNTNIFAVYTPTLSRPIMGLKTWVSETDGSRKLVAIDTRRASVFNDSTEVFDPIDSISQILWVGDGATTAITFLTRWVAVSPYTNALAPFSVSVTDGTSTIVDDGVGGFNTSGNFAAGGTVNYATGSIHLVFTIAPVSTVTITMTARLVGDYFTGTSSAFFNSTNWLGNLYLTNNVDYITVYDGSALSRPPFPITQAHLITYTNDIAKALDLDVYKNRLIVQRDTIVGSSVPEGQTFRISKQFNPTNLVADVAGNGGQITAPTDDFIQSSEFLRDQIIVFFANSTWIFRYTQSDQEPFRWDKLNSTKSTNAPYGTVAYDERVTAMGAKGLIACDGTNVERYDPPVIDQFLDINIKRFFQCYGLRFDTLNQTWMLYPSVENNATLSDKVLVYNFAENTWATYNIALSCLGLYYVIEDMSWDDFAVGSQNPTTWEQAEFAWDSYLLQQLAPIMVGGSQSGGYVYNMNDGDTDSGTVIDASMTGARWNPFMNLGQKVQFGYIDFYYERDTTVSDPAVLNLTFFADNSEAPTAVRTLTLDGSVTDNAQSKRIYINVVGQFLRMNLESNSTAGFKILGMVLWASPSGRFTPGSTVT